MNGHFIPDVKLPSFVFFTASCLLMIVLMSLKWRHAPLAAPLHPLLREDSSSGSPQIDLTLHRQNPHLSLLHSAEKQTNPQPFLRASLMLPGCGSWWRCWGSSENIVWTTVKHSSLQLPRSKAEDYQQPAVMRPQWLEIAGTAWCALPQPQHRYERLRWNTLRKTTVI